MKTLLFILLSTSTFCISCSKKATTSSFNGNWAGLYFANNVNYGSWKITIDNNGDITGKIISAPAFQSYEFSVTGNVNSNGSISFVSYISSTIQWRFEGTLSNTSANGVWIAESIPGNPPNKIWSGNKQ